MSSASTAVLSVALVFAALLLCRLAWQRLTAWSDRGYQQWRERWH